MRPSYTRADHSSTGAEHALPACFGVAEQGRRRTRAYRDPGRGPTFEARRASAPATTRSAAPASSAPAPRGDETVLVVEDEAIVRRVVMRVLRELGYDALEAENGVAALELARMHSEPIDLVIADVVMPGMSGSEFRRALRLARPKTKVIFMSGYTNDAALEPGLVDEGDGFLSKPFSPSLLARQVREILDA